MTGSSVPKAIAAGGLLASRSAFASISTIRRCSIRTVTSSC